MSAGITHHDSIESVVDLIERREALATMRCVSLAGQRYCPASGSEGVAFEDAWCCQCVHYREVDKEVWDCRLDILGQAHAVADVTLPEFPKEWVYDIDGLPSCTRFEDVPADDDRKMHRLCGGVVSPEAERSMYDRAMRGEL